MYNKNCKGLKDFDQFFSFYFLNHKLSVLQVCPKISSTPSPLETLKVSSRWTLRLASFVRLSLWTTRHVPVLIWKSRPALVRRRRTVPRGYTSPCQTSTTTHPFSFPHHRNPCCYLRSPKWELSSTASKPPTRTRATMVSSASTWSLRDLPAAAARGRLAWTEVVVRCV